MNIDFMAFDGSTVTPKTRADLMRHPAFADLNTDSDGNPCVWENHYYDGETDWSFAWSCKCDDEGVEPVKSLWVGPGHDAQDRNGFYRLWQALPEAQATYPTPITPEAKVKAVAADQPTEFLFGVQRIQHAEGRITEQPFDFRQAKWLGDDQPKPMWLCVWVTNYGNNNLRDSFTIHESEAEAMGAYAEVLTLPNLHSAAIAPICKATEPEWQDQR